MFSAFKQLSMLTFTVYKSNLSGGFLTLVGYRFASAVSAFRGLSTFTTGVGDAGLSTGLGTGTGSGSASGTGTVSATCGTIGSAKVGCSVCLLGPLLMWSKST